MIYLALGLLTFILLIYIVSTIGNTRQIDNDHLHDEREQLETDIVHLTIQLEQLKTQYSNNSVNNVVKLPQATVSVLDVYERSNIRIPQDIIESLSYMTFTSDKDTFDYIENQRNYWKLENTKKPYRRVK